MSFSTRADSEMDALLNMSLEELMEQKISIATKSEKSLSTTAASVFVISADDIRRSGAANIPESLRMAPGLQVIQVNPHDWNVSIRGLNDQAANRFLVLVDGRSVSGNFNAGTYWRELQGMPLESIERIEIIRGSGGTIWGVNAMNGVINIITRSALTTKDAQLTAGGGSAQQDFGRFDYTKKITENASVRGYGTYYNVANAKGDKNYNGSAGSGWTNGARFDWNNKQGDEVMADANWSENDSEESGALTSLKPPYTQTINSQPFNHQNGHFLTRWEHHLNDKNYWAIRSFYDHTNRKDFQIQTKIDVFDVDFTHYFSLGERHNLTWGTGYRRANDEIGNTLMVKLNPTSGNTDIFNVFAQDEIALDENKQWIFTLGSKFEYHTLTGFETEPSGSLSWHVNDKHTLWTSVSHAVRVPSRGQSSDATYLIYNSSRNFGNTELPVIVQGNIKKGIGAENSTTYQMGWRGAFNQGLTADATIFYTNYNDIIRSEAAGEPTINNSLGIPAIISPWLGNNNLYAQSFGTELSLNWQATEWWRNYLSYSFLNMDVKPYVGHTLTFYDPVGLEHSTPQHQVSLRTNFNVTQDIDFDVWWRYTDKIITNQRPIAGYFNTDTRIAWRPVKGLELSLIGQNLIQTQHLEYQGDLFQPQATYVSRGIYAKFNWQF
ncbi:MAG: TonB-dependent receptor [Methylococcales bacterium]|nr:TonB-dependent receptor [Methylococcales bacterium]